MMARWWYHEQVRSCAWQVDIRPPADRFATRANGEVLADFFLAQETLPAASVVVEDVMRRCR